MASNDVIASEAASRYASALLELAQDAKSLKSVEKDLKTLKGLFAKSAELTRLATSPILVDNDKVKALLAIAKKAKLGKLTTQFIGTCAQNQRAGEIPAIIASFEEKLAKQRGTGSAQVFSAKKLTSAQLGSIKAQLKKSL